MIWTKTQALHIKPRNFVRVKPPGVSYVVIIPQSSTAHQAPDKKYYKRSNFESVPMKHAAEKIVKHLECSDEKVSLRAAEDVIEFAKEFISLEDHERRIKELEERLEQAEARAGLRKPALAFRARG